jgi:large subunit ribosomal protein L24
MSIKRIKKGDNVLVIAGKDKNKSGKVIAIHDSKAIVSGLNIYKKSMKPSNKYPQGGIVDVNAPIPQSNLMPICPGCKKAVRVKVKNTGKEKRRVCIKCSEVIDAA